MSVFDDLEYLKNTYKGLLDDNYETLKLTKERYNYLFSTSYEERIKDLIRVLKTIKNFKPRKIIRRLKKCLKKK